MWPYPRTHVGTPSHLGHMDRVAVTMPSQAHAGAAQELPDIGQWDGQDVPLVRPSSCNVKVGIPNSRRYLPTYLQEAVVYPRHPLLPLGVSFEPLPQQYRLPPGGTLPPHRGKQHWGSSKYHEAAYLVWSPMVGESYCLSFPTCHHPAQCSTKNAPTQMISSSWGRTSPECPHPYDHPNWEHLNTRAYMNRFPPFGTQS